MLNLSSRIFYFLFDVCPSLIASDNKYWEGEARWGEDETKPGDDECLVSERTERTVAIITNFIILLCWSHHRTNRQSSCYTTVSLYHPHTMHLKLALSSKFNILIIGICDLSVLLINLHKTHVNLNNYISTDWVNSSIPTIRIRLGGSPTLPLEIGKTV